MVIIPALVFLAVTCAVAGIVIWALPTRTEKRLEAIIPPTEKQTWTATAVNVVGPFAKLSTPADQWETSKLRVMFFNAGIRSADARLIYFGTKTLLPIIFGFSSFFVFRLMGQTGGMTLVFYLMLSALLGCYIPNLALHLAIKARKREIFDNFPDASDLMLVCVEAGLGLDAALTRVAEEIKMRSVSLAEELHLTNLEIRAGSTREKALRNLALRTGIEEISAFATMLTQADKFGTSIGESLRVFSEDLRHKRQVRAEEMAAKIPTKLLFPLVVCIFPSIIMVILGPAIIQIIRTILPMISNGG